MNNSERSILFGKIMGTADVLSSRVFKNGQPTISEKYLIQMKKKPMSTMFNVHIELLEYVKSAGEKEEKLFDIFAELMGQLTDDILTDEPLSGQYQLSFYIQRDKLTS